MAVVLVKVGLLYLNELFHCNYKKQLFDGSRFCVVDFGYQEIEKYLTVKAQNWWQTLPAACAAN